MNNFLYDVFNKSSKSEYHSIAKLHIKFGSTVNVVEIYNTIRPTRLFKNYIIYAEFKNMVNWNETIISLNLLKTTLKSLQ